MKVAQLGVIVDFGITNNQSSQTEHLYEEVTDFLRSLNTLNGFRVVYVESKYGDYTQIKNFNYNINNQAEENQKYRIFRSFQNKVFIQYNEDVSLEEFNELYWFRHNHNLYCLNVSSLGKETTSKKTSEYVGKSKVNSGEILEERVTQYELF